MPERITVKIPDAHLTLFDVQRSGQPEIIVVNDALLAFRHPTVFPWHLRVSIDAKDLIENGMPSPAEGAVLDRVGEAIEEVVLAGRTDSGADNAIFLARSTWNGLRELLYRVHDPEITHQELQRLLKLQSHERAWDYRISHDIEWSMAANVFQLFPQARGSDA